MKNYAFFRISLLSGLCLGAFLSVSRAEEQVKPIRVERATFVVEHNGGQGSGFLLQTSNEVFFVSNIHVLAGGENFSIRNVYGETIQVPKQIEVASDRDLIRFPVNYPRGFELAEEFAFGDKICAVGNSGGGGVVTRLDGEILAMGPDLVEVSAKFIPGNSGGPVLSEENKVVGVSTYLQNHSFMPNWIIEGSRFEETRRMSVRVDNVEWVSMDWDELSRQIAYVDEVEEYSHAAIHIVDSLSSNTYSMIYSDVEHAGLQKWLQTYNQDVRKTGGRMKKVTEGDRIRYEVSSSIERNFRQDLSGLAALLKKFERAASHEEKVSLPFLKEKLSRYRRYFDSSSKQVEVVVETMF